MDRLPANVDVVRSLGAAPEFRQVAGEIGTLYGHFSTFDSWYEVSSMWEGDFLERVTPGAFAQTIAEDRDGMRVLFDHGFDPQLGNKVLGPIDGLAEDSRGAAYEVPLFDTSYNRDLLPGLRAGVYGASMRMRVLSDTWDDEPMPSPYNPKGLPERSITRAKVMEFGPVTFPASPSASAGVRSITDHFYEQLKRRDAPAYADACRAAGRRAPHRAVTRATDATIEELVSAADALVDQVEAALADGDVEAAAALLTALDETVDSQMAVLGIPDSDEADSDAMASSRPRGAARPKVLTGRPGARSAGGGGKDGEPGTAAASARTEAEARHHTMLLLRRANRNG